MGSHIRNKEGKRREKVDGVSREEEKEELNRQERRKAGGKGSGKCGLQLIKSTEKEKEGDLGG